MLAAPVTFLGYFHVAFFGILIPIGAWRQKRRFAAAGSSGAPNFAKYAVRMIATLVTLTAVSLETAYFESIRIFPRTMPPLSAVIVGAAILVGAVLLMRPRWRRSIERQEGHIRLFVAETPRQRALWIVISTLAGVGEEITWRGVQFTLLVALTGNAAIAAFLSAASFAVAHVVQGWKSVLVVFGFALVFQSLASLAGSLYVAMGVHLLYDVAAGLTLSKYAATRR